jgi:hypothetical protein
MARNNGVFADMEGDCLLYGDTTGSLYRSRSDKSTTSDVFVVKLSQTDGTYAKTVEVNKRHHYAIAIFGLLFLTCLVCGFYRRGKFLRILRRRNYNKQRAYEVNDSIFKDDPSTGNDNHRNGQYKDALGDDDDDDYFDSSYPPGGLELSMTSQPYKRRAPGKPIV